MHEVRHASPSAQPFGCHFDGARLRVGSKPEKLWRLRRAFNWLASGAPVSGRQVEVLLGHFVVESLHHRPLLSVPRALYAFIRDSYFDRVPLWDSAAREAPIVAALLPPRTSDLEISQAFLKSLRFQGNIEINFISSVRY